MSSQRCLGCRTTYAASVPACPQCGETGDSGERGAVAAVPGPGRDAGDEVPDYAVYPVKDLRALATSRGVPSAGPKAALAARLAEHDRSRVAAS